MKKLLFINCYDTKSAFPVINYINPDKIILINDTEENKEQTEATEQIINAYNKIKEISEIKTDKTNLADSAKRLIEEIDKYREYEIYIDVSSGRRLKMLASLFTSYLRAENIKKVICHIHETQEIITIPKIKIKIDSIDSIILDLIKEPITKKELIEKIKKTKTIELDAETAIYKRIKKLKEKSIIDENRKKINITDLGKLIETEKF
jgi:hypothetical protein